MTAQTAFQSVGKFERLAAENVEKEFCMADVKQPDRGQSVCPAVELPWRCADPDITRFPMASQPDKCHPMVRCAVVCLW